MNNQTQITTDDITAMFAERLTPPVLNLATAKADRVKAEKELRNVRGVIEWTHYLKRWPDPRSLPFAYVLDFDGRREYVDGYPFGIVVFKKPQHHKQRGLFGYEGLPTAWQVLDLARVWIHPCLQKSLDNGHSVCMFSRMVGSAIRQVQRDWLEHHPPRYPDQPYHIELIISYCDLSHHDGVGYRASGFTSAGLTSDKSKEVYYRKLKPPKKSWQPVGQPPLLGGLELPIRH